jgi:hypothetical protein
MQVTLSLMANDGVSQDPVNIPHEKTDQLILDFQVDGCFCTSHANDFKPKLPNFFCAAGSHRGPYTPRHSDHDTQYSWDTSQNCNCEGQRIAMHTIHTGS